MNRSVLKLSDDVVFRALFGAERLSVSLMGLLNAILREVRLPQVKSLTLKNPFLLETWKNEKEPILDVRVVDEEEREYDVEMQCRREKYYVGRAVYYTFRLHVDQLERSAAYHRLKRTVGISLTTFPIDSARPDVWFDVWKYRSTLDSGLGYEDAINIFVRLPTSRDEKPIGINDPELLNWIDLIAFYPYLSDEEIELIERSTSGATEILQDVKMFAGTKYEHELIQAKERYWHDQASRVYEYEEEIRAKDAAIRTRDETIRSQGEQLRSQGEQLRSRDDQLRSQGEQLRSVTTERLAAERKIIARTLSFRFNKPVAASLALLDVIDSSETLNRLSDISDECKDYDDFLKHLANCTVKA